MTVQFPFRRTGRRTGAALQAVPGSGCPGRAGAFRVPQGITRGMTARGLERDAAVCDRLLDEAGGAMVPGRAFGLPGLAQLSFACSDAELDAGLARSSIALGA